MNLSQLILLCKSNFLPSFSKQDWWALALVNHNFYTVSRRLSINSHHIFKAVRLNEEKILITFLKTLDIRKIILKDKPQLIKELENIARNGHLSVTASLLMKAINPLLNLEDKNQLLELTRIEAYDHIEAHVRSKLFNLEITSLLFNELKSHYIKNSNYIKLLLRLGANPNAQDDDGNTPLHLIAKTNNSQREQEICDIISVLLTVGANPEILNNEGLSPLHICVDNNHLRSLVALLNNGASFTLNKQAKIDLLFRAFSYYGCPALAEYLLQDPEININTDYDIDGNTVLHASLIGVGVSVGANWFWYNERVQLCFKYGADANIKNINGMTPLQFAAINGCYWSIKQGGYELLIQHGARIDEQHPLQGDTALMMALKKNHHDVVEFLIEKGANLYLRNNDGLTPLHLAAAVFCMSKEREKNIKSVENLLKNAAEVNTLCSKLGTPLHIAALGENLELVQLLLKYEASPCFRDSYYQTPAEITKIPDIKKILLSAENVAKNHHDATSPSIRR